MVNILNQLKITFNKIQKSSVDIIDNIPKDNIELLDKFFHKFFHKLQKNKSPEGKKLKSYLVSAMEYFINENMYKDKAPLQRDYINKKIAELKPSNSNIQSEIGEDIKGIFKYSFNRTITGTITVAA